MGRFMRFLKCGTKEDWERHREKYPGMYQVVPATIFISENGLCLVTSKEWTDWLLGETDNIPSTQ